MLKRKLYSNFLKITPSKKCTAKILKVIHEAPLKILVGFVDDSLSIYAGKYTAKMSSN
jgi:hypothetical protein